MRRVIVSLHAQYARSQPSSIIQKPFMNPLRMILILRASVSSKKIAKFFSMPIQYHEASRSLTLLNASQVAIDVCSSHTWVNTLVVNCGKTWFELSSFLLDPDLSPPTSSKMNVDLLHLPPNYQIMHNRRNGTKFERLSMPLSTPTSHDVILPLRYCRRLWSSLAASGHLPETVRVCFDNRSIVWVLSHFQYLSTATNAILATRESCSNVNFMTSRRTRSSLIALRRPLI